VSWGCGAPCGMGHDYRLHDDTDYPEMTPHSPLFGLEHCRLLSLTCGRRLRGRTISDRKISSAVAIRSRSSGTFLLESGKLRQARNVSVRDSREKLRVAGTPGEIRPKHISNTSRDSRRYTSPLYIIITYCITYRESISQTN
jgi:hypothetical protein